MTQPIVPNLHDSKYSLAMDSSAFVPEKAGYDLKAWLTDEQNRAYASGDEEAIRQADDEAFKNALAQSKASFIQSGASLVHDAVSEFLKQKGASLLDAEEVARLQDSPVKASPGSPSSINAGEGKKKELSRDAQSNYEQHVQKLKELNGQLKSWFETRGFEVVPNQGHNNNCAIISLLQLATGDLSAHSDAAQALKSWMVASYPGEVRGISEPVYANTSAMERLIEKINQEYGTDMKVSFVMADEKGEPVITSEVGSGQKNVVIFDRGGHFDAVVPKLP